MTVIRSLQEGIWTTEVWLEDYDMDVRGLVILGGEKAVVWDTLTHPRDMETVRDLLLDRDIWVVYSHADWDHVWGTCGLSSDKVISHRAALERFYKEVPETLTQMRAEKPGVWDAVQIVCPTIVFDSYMRIDLGGMSLELYSLPGHTVDSIIGLIPERKTFLGGDAVEDPFPVLGESLFLTKWIEGLSYWSEHSGVQTVVPAHGAIGSCELIARNKKYLEGLVKGSSSLPEGVSEFYRQSHLSNVKLAQKAIGK